MSFKDNYTDDAKEADKKKLVSTDTFLFAEMLELIIKHLSMKNG